MLGMHIKWEQTPPGAVRAGEQCALAGRRGPQELLNWHVRAGEHCSSRT
jgi:hypothetical protein